MIIEINEYNYRGFQLVHVDGKGWKIVLGEEEYLFQNAVAAESAINEFIIKVIPAHDGKKIKHTK